MIKKKGTGLLWRRESVLQLTAVMVACSCEEQIFELYTLNGELYDMCIIFQSSEKTQNPVTASHPRPGDTQVPLSYRYGVRALALKPFVRLIPLHPHTALICRCYVTPILQTGILRREISLTCPRPHETLWFCLA